MSRFSRAEAEARGWRFAHADEGGDHVLSSTQGRVQLDPPSYRAEKYFNNKLINEEAHTTGLLLERIAAFEAFQESFIDSEPFPEALPNPENLDDADLPLRTVIAADGLLREEDWANRDRVEALADEDGQHIFAGGIPEVQAEAERRQEFAAEVENLRAAEPDSGETEQIHLDPADVGVDSPGHTGTGTVVVRKDEDDPVAGRQDRSAEREQDRVLADKEFGSQLAPPEHDVLAGVDVGIQARGDLGSEIPRIDAVEEEEDEDSNPSGYHYETRDDGTRYRVYDESDDAEAEAEEPAKAEEDADEPFPVVVDEEGNASHPGDENYAEAADEAVEEAEDLPSAD